ncbi:MAG: hypothetical protein ABI663_00070 [Chryseolinea sp.]
MRQTGTIAFILISLNLFAQEVKRVVSTYPELKDVKEVYYVLKPDQNIKQGNYYSFFKGELKIDELKTKNLANDILGFKEKGQFKNNLKEGSWIYFKAPRQNSATSVYNNKKEEGEYSNDEKIGV